MGYNFNQPAILAKVSSILNVTVTDQSMNGRANALHGIFLKTNSKSSYLNKADYADAVIDFNSNLLSKDLSAKKTDSAAIRFNKLIQDASVKNFLHDFYQTRY